MANSSENSVSSTLDDFYGQPSALAQAPAIAESKSKPLTFGRVVLAVLVGNLLTSLVVGIAYYALTH
jgi:hypothetical protein